MVENPETFEDEERKNVLWLLDSFIDQVNSMRKFLGGVAISAIIMTPFALMLSVFLITHPSFFAILEKEDQFGLMLLTLLILIIVISSILFITGLLQYRKIKSWYKNYQEYRRITDDIDKKISEKFDFDD